MVNLVTRSINGAYVSKIVIHLGEHVLLRKFKYLSKHPYFRSSSRRHTLIFLSNVTIRKLQHHDELYIFTPV